MALRLGQFVDHDIDKEVLNPAVNVDVTVPAGDPNFRAGTDHPARRLGRCDAVNTVAGYSRSVAGLWVRRGDR